VLVTNQLCMLSMLKAPMATSVARLQEMPCGVLAVVAKGTPPRSRCCAVAKEALPPVAATRVVHQRGDVCSAIMVEVKTRSTRKLRCGVKTHPEAAVIRVCLCTAISTSAGCVSRVAQGSLVLIAVPRAPEAGIRLCLRRAPTSTCCHSHANPSSAQRSTAHTAASLCPLVSQQEQLQRLHQAEPPVVTCRSRGLETPQHAARRSMRPWQAIARSCRFGAHDAAASRKHDCSGESPVPSTAATKAAVGQNAALLRYVRVMQSAAPGVPAQCGMGTKP
jgi:hypothetical protein